MNKDNNDGKNAKNLEARKNKAFASTCGINSIAGTDILRKIETKVISLEIEWCAWGA